MTEPSLLGFVEIGQYLIARAARYRRPVPAIESEAISCMIRGVKVLRSSSTQH